MAISLKPKHLKRYKDIALLVFKYGRKGLGSNGARRILVSRATSFRICCGTALPRIYWSTALTCA